MGFADSLLSTGERIIHREKQHWFVFVWGARFTILALIVGIILAVSNVGQDRGPVSATSSAGSWRPSSSAASRSCSGPSCTT